MLLQFFISGYFTYRIGKEHLHLSEFSCVFAAISYSIFRNNDVYFQFGFALFPFLLWVLDRIHEKSINNKKLILWVVPLGLVYASSSSIVVTLPFVLIMLPTWFLLVRRNFDLRFIGILFPFYLIVVLSQWQIFYAMILNVPLSHRMVWVPETDLVVIARSVLSIFTHPHNDFHHILFIPLILIACIASKFKDYRFNALLFLVLCTTFGILCIVLIKPLLPTYWVFYQGFNLFDCSISPIFLFRCALCMLLKMSPTI